MSATKTTQGQKYFSVFFDNEPVDGHELVSLAKAVMAQQFFAECGLADRVEIRCFALKQT